jgi:hypothetical protein
MLWRFNIDLNRVNFHKGPSNLVQPHKLRLAEG